MLNRCAPTNDYFFFNATATTVIYTLSLHDALPIFGDQPARHVERSHHRRGGIVLRREAGLRSEEHTSELQSHVNLVCRLQLEKKKAVSRGTRPDASVTRLSALR